MLTILATVAVVSGQNQVNMNVQGGKLKAGMDKNGNYAQFKRGQNTMNANMNGQNSTVNMNMMGNSVNG